MGISQYPNPIYVPFTIFNQQQAYLSWRSLNASFSKGSSRKALEFNSLLRRLPPEQPLKLDPTNDMLTMLRVER